VSSRRLEPLTERILNRLPGPRALWIVIWALIPWLNAGANLLLDTGARSAVWEQGTILVILNYAALSLAVVITLWGSSRIIQRVETLGAATSAIFGGGRRQTFREMDDAAGPLVLAAATALAFGTTALASDGWEAALLRGCTWFVLGTGLWTFLWTYASLQLGLDRLGRERLRLDAVRLDPTLGLEPVGGVAFMGLWMLLAWLVPLVLTGLPEIVGVGIGVAILCGALASFFLSMVRLHRQMAAVKVAEVEVARKLYAEAYEPVRASPTLDALERQHSHLSAAEALEKRPKRSTSGRLTKGRSRGC
jgi:hypothetical protein